MMILIDKIIVIVSILFSYSIWYKYNKYKGYTRSTLIPTTSITSQK